MTLRKLVIIFSALCYTVVNSYTVFAQTASDEAMSIYNGTTFYDPNSGCGSISSGLSGNSDTTTFTGESYSTTIRGGTRVLPTEWIPILAQAGQRFQVDPSILAALLAIETNWTPPGDFELNPMRNNATATGPFQFLDSTAVEYMPGPDPHAGSGYTNPSLYTGRAVKLVNNGSDLDTDGRYLTDGNKDGVVDRANPYDSAYMAAVYLRTLGASTTTPLGTAGDYRVPSQAFDDQLTVRLIGAYYNQGPNFSAPNAQTAADLNALASGGNNVANYMDYMMNITDAGRSSGVYGTVSTSSAGLNDCPTECSASATGGNVVVLDPGHVMTPSTGRVIDPETGIDVTEDTREFETRNVWDIAQDAKSQLEELGYSVILTKDSVEDSSINLRSRAEVANAANAALAISIHTTPSGNNNTGNEVFYQKVGNGLFQDLLPDRWLNLNPRPTNYDFPFTDQELETQSLAAAQVLASQMQTAGIATTPVKVSGDANSTRGSMWTVQYFSKIPWIYAEVGSADSVNNINQTRKTQYATAIVNSVQEILSSSGGGSGSGCSNGAVQGDIVQTAINFAWTKKEESDAILAADRQADATSGCPRMTQAANQQLCGQQRYDAGAMIGEANAKPAFIEAVKEYNAAYSSDGAVWPYSDCGVFVSTVMRASGADPNYPQRGTTIPQLPYALDPANGYTAIRFTDTSLIQPGDVLLKAGHTAIYIGPNSHRNDADVIDASWGQRTPTLMWNTSGYLDDINPNSFNPEDDYYIFRRSS